MTHIETRSTKLLIRIPLDLSCRLDDIQTGLKAGGKRKSKESLVVDCISLALNESDNESISISDPGLNNNAGTIEKR